MKEACRYTPIACLRREDVLWAMVCRLERHVHRIFTRPLVQSQQSLIIGLYLENMTRIVSLACFGVLNGVQHVSIEFTSIYSLS